MSLKKFSFASRLRRAQDIHAILKSFDNYNPPRTEESLAGFQAFIDSLVDTNNTETNLMKEYRMLVDDRKKVFYKNTHSVNKLFPALKSVVRLQYGKSSTELALLDTITDRMKYSKGVKSNEPADNSEQKKSVSHSEKTFGSMTKNFNDFITTISGFDSYQPGQDTFKIDNLKAIAVDLNTKNDAVMEKLTQLRVVKRERLDLYKQLSDRINRIKFYVRSKYGANSSEFAQIRSI